MSHEPQIVEAKQVTNEQVSYRIVCCGESCSQETCRRDAHSCEDSWATLSIHDDDHESKLKAYKQEVAARHETMTAWRHKNSK